MKIMIRFLFFLCAIHIHSQEKNIDFLSLEQTIQQAIKNKEIPSAVIAIAKDDKIIYQKAFGYADINKNIKARVHTPYQLASTSKPITATAIMMLHQKGIIHIDSLITNYAPELGIKKAYPDISIPTIRHVLGHVSGLGTYFDIGYTDEKYNFDDFIKGWKKYGKIFHNPGVTYEYSNLGYGLLDHIIHKTTTKTFSDFLNKELFTPLKMNNSFVNKNSSNTNIPAKKYTRDLLELPEVVNNTLGAGNIYSSVLDLVRFGMFHVINEKSYNQILNIEARKLMQSTKHKDALYHLYEDSYYGLGWYIRPNDNGYRMVWHEGGMIGASSMLKLIPENNVVIAVITNVYNNPFCRKVTNMLSNIVLKKYQPSAINEIAAYKPVTSNPDFIGTWMGSMTINEKKIPVQLIIEADRIWLEYPDDSLSSFFTQGQPIPSITQLFFGMINNNSFLGTTSGNLPSSDLRKEYNHLLSLKLIKQKDRLSGTITAMAAASREYYAYPYAIELYKKL